MRGTDLRTSGTLMVTYVLNSAPRKSALWHSSTVLCGEVGEGVIKRFRLQALRVLHGLTMLSSTIFTGCRTLYCLRLSRMPCPRSTYSFIDDACAEMLSAVSEIKVDPVEVKSLPVAWELAGRLLVCLPVIPGSATAMLVLAV